MAVSDIIVLIIKMAFPLIASGMENSYFPLIHMPNCYRTVCYRTVQQANHFQRCSLNQPITNIKKFTPPLSIF